MSTRAKYQIIDKCKNSYPIGTLCAYLKVSKSGYYGWIKKGKPSVHAWNTYLAEKIQIIFDSSHKGYRYIWMQLQRI